MNAGHIVCTGEAHAILHLVSEAAEHSRTCSKAREFPPVLPPLTLGWRHFSDRRWLWRTVTDWWWRVLRRSWGGVRLRSSSNYLGYQG